MKLVGSSEYSVAAEGVTEIGSGVTAVGGEETAPLHDASVATAAPHKKKRRGESKVTARPWRVKRLV